MYKQYESSGSLCDVKAPNACMITTYRNVLPVCSIQNSSMVPDLLVMPEMISYHRSTKSVIGMMFM